MLQPPSLPLHAILPQACFGLTAGPLIDSIHNQKLLGEQGLHANLSSPRRAHPRTLSHISHIPQNTTPFLLSSSMAQCEQA